MDKEIRGQIRDATQAARGLLERDYRKQLEGTFDILLEQPGSHLSDHQKVIREKLVAAIAHKRSSGLDAKEALDAYLREAAFTTLNRFVALKMLEARNLVQECVSKGEDSSGFKEFAALAPGLVAVDDKGYRIYIETIFDEIGQEVRVLFDRRDVASLLWPDRQTLLELLGILNAPELASVWAEDETIGWVYQYFNGDEERARMRKESQAPRNSRELAVRNQFFTPRYVVQFLTDNTLGRTWYEMMQGETKLAHLDYRVRRPNEVFLADGELAPDSELDDRELSQEELLQQTVYVPFRAKKDPRDVRILDPACGSGHFLLYAFDLLVKIYEEAWGDAEAAAFIETGTLIREDYGRIEDLRIAMPELILRNNLHGVEIDPRAAQIAALALWMRAQRAYNEFQVDRDVRPPITKTNIVVAEPMPGDAELVDEFAASLKPAVLGDLFRKIVEEMRLAGELGSLLKIEESISNSVLEAAESSRQGNLFAGNIESQDFWDTADDSIIAALRRFADAAVGSEGVRHQLFAGDSAQGVAFINLMRKRFDTVLMNPPFGEPTGKTNSILKKQIPGKAKNLYSGFIERSANMAIGGGFVGCICSRSFVTYRKFETLRKLLLSAHTISVMADLGWGVLDAAQVETAALVIHTSIVDRLSGPFFKLLTVPPAEKAEALRTSLLGEAEDHAGFTVDQAQFARLPGSPLCYWSSSEFINEVADAPSLQPEYAFVGQGASPHAFFFRAWWECNSADLGNRWVRIARGGRYSPYYRENNLVIDWSRNGRAVKAHVLFRYPYLDGNFGWKIQDEQYYQQPGLTWGKRNERFNVQAMPAGHIFTDEGQGIVVSDAQNALFLLGYLNSSIVAYYLSLTSGLQKHYVYVRPVPILSGAMTRRAEIANLTAEILSQKMYWSTVSETSPLFRSPLPGGIHRDLSIQQHINECEKQWRNDQGRLRFLADEIDETIFAGSNFSEMEIDEMMMLRAEYPEDTPSCGVLRPDEPGLEERIAKSVISWSVGACFGRWDLRVATRGYESAGPGPLERLPNSPPGLLTGGNGLPVSVQPKDYPIPFSDGAILVNDRGHHRDLSNTVLGVFNLVFSDGKARWNEAAQLVGSGDHGFNAWFAKSFFPDHIDRYTRSRRKAPIYWQLATPSASYSVWCYYHRLTRDTFFRVTNDYVSPKVDHEERKLVELNQEAGLDPSKKQRKAIDVQETFVAELRAFETEVKRIAPLWNPNLNDGVIINFAPLWRLVPQHKPWQKECKKVWDKLVKGDYDWAHLAMHLWPERVVPKCQDDRSLAIAHGLEDEFWYEDDNGKKTQWEKRRVSSDRVAELVAERSSTAVKAALEDLLSAPTPSGGKKRRKRVANG